MNVKLRRSYILYSYLIARHKILQGDLGNLPWFIAVFLVERRLIGRLLTYLRVM